MCRVQRTVWRSTQDWLRVIERIHLFWNVRRRSSARFSRSMKINVALMSRASSRQVHWLIFQIVVRSRPFLKRTDDSGGMSETLRSLGSHRVRSGWDLTSDTKLYSKICEVWTSAVDHLVLRASSFVFFLRESNWKLWGWSCSVFCEVNRWCQRESLTERDGTCLTDCGMLEELTIWFFITNTLRRSRWSGLEFCIFIRGVLYRGLFATSSQILFQIDWTKIVVVSSTSSTWIS